MATDVVLIILFVVQYEYLDWEFYHKNCNTLQGDREYVYFWEKLSSKTKVRVMWLIANFWSYVNMVL